MLLPLLEQALASRVTLFDAPHESAFRLFNGFSEGYPDLTIEIYARTFIIHNYADDPASETNQRCIREVIQFLTMSLNWLRAGIIKTRHGKSPTEKNGVLVFGEQTDVKVKEYGVWYAINLTINRDTSFYLDTRNVRQWLIGNASDKTVLNTFAYTGSLGVAALAGGASHVTQHDRSRLFLSLAKDSYLLNGFPVHNQDFNTHDFFSAVAKFKSARQLFDCVILDPPFFSSTSKGKVDLVNESARLINKVRPLVKDGGYLVTINNAVYVSGGEYLQTLAGLCKDGYLSMETFIPAPQDCTGYNTVNAPITDPSPFNHSTKIAILKVRRKLTGGYDAQ